MASLIAKAVDTTGDGLVSGAVSALCRLRDRLRRRFTEEGDTDALLALERVEGAPDSPSRLITLGQVVDRHADDAAFRAELEVLADAAEPGIIGTMIRQNDSGIVIQQDEPVNSPAFGQVRDVTLVYEAVTDREAVCACGRKAEVACTSCQVQFCRRHVPEPLEIDRELADLERRYSTALVGREPYVDDRVPSRELTVVASVFFQPDRDGVVVCKVCRLGAVKDALSLLPPRPLLPQDEDPVERFMKLADPAFNTAYTASERQAAHDAAIAEAAAEGDVVLRLWSSLEDRLPVEQYKGGRLRSKIVGVQIGRLIYGGSEFDPQTQRIVLTRDRDRRRVVGIMNSGSCVELDGRDKTIVQLAMYAFRSGGRTASTFVSGHD